MTSEERDLFIYTAQMGIATGLTHPYEWLVGFVRLSDIFPPNDTIIYKVEQAFLHFFQGCDSHPDDPIKNLTVAEMYEMIDVWYKKRVRHESVSS